MTVQKWAGYEITTTRLGHTNKKRDLPPPVHTCTDTQLPVSSLLLIAVPKALIFGLPFTSEMMLQTRWKVSSVHFLK